MTGGTGSGTTAIATRTPDDVIVRGKSLCHDLVGKLSFTEMIMFQCLGRRPTAQQTAIVDACLVALMEHGLTPSVLASRLVYASAPDAMQAAVAAGIAGVGSQFVGTVEGCGALLVRIAQDQGAPDVTAGRIVAEHRAGGKPVPGFGHPHFKSADPRSVRLFELAREQEVAGAHVKAVLALSAALDEAVGKTVVLNATGAVAAVLADCGVPVEIMRGFAIISRCAGLVGHVHEEQRNPAAHAIWQAAEAEIPYRADPETQ